jgi:CRISPR/Cas system-associated exonuclease Cas4 (RecB family)
MMKGNILTIDDLNKALEEDFKRAQHYLKQVTVEDDLNTYLQWLHDNEQATEVHARLNRYQRRGKGIHPSSACKKNVCLLKLYYECTFEIEPKSPYDQKMQLTWDVGTLMHEMHQAWFKDMYGDQFEAEVKLQSDDGYIKSSTDGLFTFTAYRFVLEMKSIKEGGNYGWDTVQAKPMDDHVRQCHFYMWLADVPFALIFYMNKNAGLFKEHAVMFNQNLWDEIMGDVIFPVVEAAYLSETPVQPNATPGWHCRWCSFQYKCPESGGKDDDVDW